MRKFRIWLIVFASILLIVHLIMIDYHNMSWSQNDGSYIGIFSMICIIISMILSNRYDEKRNNQKK